jgi:CRISPR-associated protein Cas2
VSYSANRFNAYRIMWLIVMFDLPTETSENRRDYVLFRKKMLKSGFDMFQFSMYIRHCSSRESAEKHQLRVKKNLPPLGHVGIFMLTDKQFAQMEVFYGKEETEAPQGARQLEMF